MVSLLVCTLAAVTVIGVTASGAAPGKEREERRPRFPGDDAAVYPGLRTVADLTQPGGATRATSAGAYPRLDAPSELAFPDALTSGEAAGPNLGFEPSADVLGQRQREFRAFAE